MSKLEDRHPHAMNADGLQRSFHKHRKSITGTARDVGNRTRKLPSGAYVRIATTGFSLALLGAIPFGWSGAIAGAVVGTAIGLYDRISA